MPLGISMEYCQASIGKIATNRYWVWHKIIDKVLPDGVNTGVAASSNK